MYPKTFHKVSNTQIKTKQQQKINRYRHNKGLCVGGLWANDPRNRGTKFINKIVSH